MIVLTAAWIAASRPRVLDPVMAGRCARCSASRPRISGILGLLVL